MKYLKRYNDNVEYDIHDLINTHLSYLLDDDSFRVEVVEKDRGDRSPYYIVSLYKLISVARDIIKWEDVKSDIIPFLYTMKSEYNLINFIKVESKEYVYTDDICNIKFDRYIRSRSYGERSSDNYFMNIDNVISDEDVPNEFYNIVIVIEKKHY